MPMILQRLFRWLLVAAVVLLCGCGGPNLSNETVQQALTLELQATTRQLNRQLRLPPEGSGPVAVSRIRVKARRPLTIAGLPAYRVRGTCHLSLKVPQRRIEVDNVEFELYLQAQAEGKSWRLARPLPAGGTDSLDQGRWELIPLSS